MPFSITLTTEKLQVIAEILFGSHHETMTRTHPGKDIINRRMRLLVQSPYWKIIQARPIEEQITKEGYYQATPAEEASILSLCHYIAGRLDNICPETGQRALKTVLQRRRGHTKVLGIPEKHQNETERYFAALRCLFDDPAELPTPFLNALRANGVYPGYDGPGVASFLYLGQRYSVRLIAAAVWRAASDKRAKWTSALDTLSTETALATSRENFIDVLVECLRAYSLQHDQMYPFDAPDNPSCDLGSIERLLLRGAPYNSCFSPPRAEDEHNKLIELQQMVDHYMIDKIDRLYTTENKALLFRVLNRRILMDEDTALAKSEEEIYDNLFRQYKDLLKKAPADEAKTLYSYLSKKLAGFPWQTKADDLHKIYYVLCIN